MSSRMSTSIPPSASETHFTNAVAFVSPLVDAETAYRCFGTTCNKSFPAAHSCKQRRLHWTTCPDNHKKHRIPQLSGTSTSSFFRSILFSRIPPWVLGLTMAPQEGFEDADSPWNDTLAAPTFRWLMAASAIVMLRV
ncbi:hypothetical protein BP6252_02147 [Coleophoma cylindrospora]|uniref:Uncharacterized protein n=1 Tax=Coleophoma cylindrospora TaxID=1849047 RepID=A0A3D8SDY4_9HELO|nr:hypothetical protein BP6252_02147 [Coleophoma cylindrospora]